MAAPIDVARYNYQLMRTKLLEEMPELVDDPECLLDTLDGLTDFTDQLGALVRSAVDDEAMADGIAEYQAKLADRKSKLQARAIRKRRIALRYMEDLELKKIRTPDMTITRKTVPPSVLITDPDKIPDDFMRKKFEIDKAKIKDALKAGELVPGAVMSNGHETLQVTI